MSGHFASPYRLERSATSSIRELLILAFALRMEIENTSWVWQREIPRDCLCAPLPKGMKLKVEMREEGKSWSVCTWELRPCSCGITAFRSLQATQEELDVEQGLCQVCRQHGVKIQTFWGSTLYHRDDIPFRPIARWVVLWCHSLLCCPVCSSAQ